MSTHATPATEHGSFGNLGSSATVLEIVRERLGLDFFQYRTATLQRRIRNRMMMVGARNLDDYLDLLRASPDEAERLAERLTIKVSRFYRNRATFDLLRQDLLPRVAAEWRDRPVDVWVAGCGCGEEAYTLAMLLEDARCQGLVHASDIDRFALRAAARGVYAAEAIGELPPDLAGRFLVPVREGSCTTYTVAERLRGRVRLHYHDLTSDAPPWEQRFALISCRNVLIYLQPAAQQQVLRLLRDNLAHGGVLVLGEAERPLGLVGNSLEAVQPRLRVFRTIGSGAGELR